MAAIDAKVADILDRRRADSDDEDDLIAELEREDDGSLSKFREQRLQQLHSEYTRAQTLKSRPGHGIYQEVKDEKELMDITTSTKLSVVHFMKPDFNRCRIMDSRLSVLAEKHFDTRFVSVNVENAPFLVVKLGIQVLPCVIAFVDGVSVDRIVGFEGVGKRSDSITASELEQRLLGCGVLVRAKMTEEDNLRRAQKWREEDEEVDEDDWD